MYEEEIEPDEQPVDNEGSGSEVEEASTEDDDEDDDDDDDDVSLAALNVVAAVAPGPGTINMYMTVPGDVRRHKAAVLNDLAGPGAKLRCRPTGESGSGNLVVSNKSFSILQHPTG